MLISDNQVILYVGQTIEIKRTSTPGQSGSGGVLYGSRD